MGSENGCSPSLPATSPHSFLILGPIAVLKNLTLELMIRLSHGSFSGLQVRFLPPKLRPPGSCAHWLKRFRYPGLLQF